MNADQVTSVKTVSSDAISSIIALTTSAISAIQSLTHVQIAAIMGSDQTVNQAADLGIAAANSQTTLKTVTTT